MSPIRVELEPLAVGIRDAVHLSGISRSELYRVIAAGNIRAVKQGRRTLVLMASLRAHLASLPAAVIRTCA